MILNKLDYHYCFAYTKADHYFSDKKKFIKETNIAQTSPQPVDDKMRKRETGQMDKNSSEYEKEIHTNTYKDDQ